MKRLLLSFLIMLVVAATLSAGVVTVKFKKPASWTQVSLYTWGPEILGGWPGTALTLSNGWYTYTTNAAFTSANFIFNNGGGATGSEQCVSINVNASMCLQASDTKNTAGEYPVNILPCTSGGMTVKYQKPASWTSANVYAWYGDAPNEVKFVGGWPGAPMTSSPDGWYTYTFDASVTATNVIFNSPTEAEQTSIAYIEASSCFPTGAYDAANGLYTITAGSCTSGIADIQEKQLSFYPNPMGDKLNFHSVNPVNQFILNTLTGECVMTVTKPSVNMTINVSQVKSGVYFMTTVFEDGQRTTEKIIKQ